MTNLRSHCHTKLGAFGTGCRPYVVKAGEGDAPNSITEFVRTKFPDNDATLELLTERVAEVVASLSDGNDLAYGIDRNQIAAYEAFLTKEIATL